MDTPAKLNSFGKIAKKRPSKVLFAQEEQIHALFEHPGWMAVMELLDEYETAERNALIQVVATNQAKAAQFAGRIQGLEAAKAAAHGILAAAQALRAELEHQNARVAEGSNA